MVALDIIILFVSKVSNSKVPHECKEAFPLTLYHVYIYNLACRIFMLQDSESGPCCRTEKMCRKDQDPGSNRRSTKHVCMSLYIYMFIYIYIYMSIRKQKLTCTYIYVHIHLHKYIGLDIFMYLFIYIYVHMYLCMHIYVCIYLHISISICICVCINIKDHIYKYM